MNKRLVLYKPLIAALLLADGITLFLAAYYHSVPLFVGALVLVAVSAVALVQIVLANKSINRFYQYMTKNMSDYRSDALKNVPVPLMVVRKAGVILWYNPAMQDRVFAGKDYFGIHVNAVFPDLNVTGACPPQGIGVEFEGKQFSAFPSPAGSEEEPMYIVYFFDDDKLKRIAKEYFASRPVAAMIMIDNYEELLQNARENERSQIMGEIEYAIETFVENYDGVIKKLEKDKFFVAFEERYIRAIVENRFPILDTVRKINANDKMPATLSIGVGRDAQNLAQAEKFANQALDMALGRGGDQAAVKNKNGYEFYGGVSKGIEKRTKVKTRIVAAALTELIQSSSNVLIMGHRFADLDCLGAAVGLYHPIVSMEKDARIVLNSKANMVGPLRDRLLENKMGDAFVEPQDALERIDDHTLLIIVDVHTPHFVESPEVYKRCRNVVVIDHHRKMVDYIDNAVIFHHEPYASSASEMVAELIQYFGEKYKPTRVVAESLLAGMMLDTKNFVLRTGVRTFEAAAYLRRMGADTVEVKSLFSSSMTSYQKKCKVVSSAEVYRHCAVSLVEETMPDIKVVSAQAADDLLGIEHVHASFVLYYESENVVSCSARSMGKLNVQVIMEKLGGGGHLTMAGAQLRDISLDTARDMLLKAVDEYYMEQEQKG